MIFTNPKIRKWLLVAGLMLAGFTLALLAGRTAGNDLAAWTPQNHSGEFIEVDE